MQINKEWHLAHPMPKNPTMDERIKWHLEHRTHCQCRTDLPRTVLEAMKEKGMPIPK